MDSSFEPSTTPTPQPIVAPKKSKKSLILTVVIIGLVLLLAGLGALYYFQHNASVDKLAATQKKLDDTTIELAKAKQAPATVATGATIDTKYRYIPEFGMKYKLTDQLKDLTYTYEPVAGSTTGLAVDFSTKALSALEEKDGNVTTNPCVSSKSPSGRIAMYTNGSEAYNGSTVQKLGKKVGSNYFVYTHPQYACGVGNTTASGLQASIDAVKAVYDSLEVDN